MSANQWIENSRKVYSSFLNFYPQEHRLEYGESMRQVFTDQCRNAYQQKGVLGVILLWLRILPDLGYTALLEHITSPRATWGLMEPVPNAPLPWKGVFLILLPGLVYLVSQIAQLTGQPWYMTIYYRAAFFLIIPVLVVWAITRRFPIWGLIPLGLLYKLLQEIGYQWVIMGGSVTSSNPLISAFFNASKIFNQELTIPTLVLTILTLTLIWRYLRQNKPSPAFWIWLGLCLLIPLIELGYYFTLESNQELLAAGEISMVTSLVTWNAYTIFAYLLLIFIGTLFIRQHGFFVILIPVGYMLPKLVTNMPWNFEYDATPVLLFIISTAVLLYRTSLSLLAPIWMSRSGSLTSKKRAILVSIAVALGVHAAIQFYPAVLYPDLNQVNTRWVVYVVFEELKLISTIILGMVIYQNTQALDNVPDGTPTQPELSTANT